MKFTTDEQEVINAVRYRPAVSIILSFDRGKVSRAEVGKKLNSALDAIKRQLLESYPKEQCSPVIDKLETMLGNVNIASLTGSLAIFVSPILSKVFLLDIPLEERIIIDESFEIRDLVYAKQEKLKYLVFLISGKHAKAFICDSGHYLKLKLARPDNVEAYENDIAESVSNFTDSSDRKEVVLEKFLKGVDDSLSQLLKQYDLPVFLVGVDRAVGHFRKLSSNKDSIVDSISGNYDEISIDGLITLLKPVINAWQTQKNQEILEQVEKGVNNHKADTGIYAIWKSMKTKNCRMLIVERNYIYPADISGDKLIKHSITTGSSPHIKDAVDDIIEQVIQNGGEVRFVEEGLLSKYSRIVLLRYY